MYVDIAAPQCRQRCLHNACGHPMDDCLVYARKIAWSMRSLSEGKGMAIAGLGHLPVMILCHALRHHKWGSRSYMLTQVLLQLHTTVIAG